MRNWNIIFSVIYIITIVIFVSGVPGGPLESLNENFFFYVIIPLAIISAVLAYPTSYKSIIFKLLPLIGVIVILWFQSIDSLAFAITIQMTFLFGIGLLITTSIARYLKRRREAANTTSF